MPCETLQSTDVQFGKETDHNSLLAALKELGLSPTQNSAHLFFSGGSYDKRTNVLTLTGQRAEERTKELKRMYMSCATQAQARKYGFTVKQGKSAYDFELVKRRI